jgi:hypothetical protein
VTPEDIVPQPLTQSEYLYDVFRRDLKALREDVLESRDEQRAASERIAGSVLVLHRSQIAHVATLERKVDELARALLIESAERRVFEGLALKYLEQVVEGASSRGVIWHLARWTGATTATTRIILAAMVAAVLASTLTACVMSAPEILR